MPPGDTTAQPVPERHLVFVSGLLSLRLSGSSGAYGAPGLLDPCGAATFDQSGWGTSRI
jgi:hypothetical protein